MRLFFVEKHNFFVKSIKIPSLAGLLARIFKSDQKQKNMTNNKLLRDKDTEISLETAERWVKKWREAKPESAKKKKVNSFLIPKYNLEKVLEQGIDAARAYIGINDKGEETLMIVGTRYDAKTEIYLDMIPRKVACNIPEAGEGEIYDFTSACPPNGDPSSPLDK